MIGPPHRQAFCTLGCSDAYRRLPTMAAVKEADTQQAQRLAAWALGKLELALETSARDYMRAQQEDRRYRSMWEATRHPTGGQQGRPRPTGGQGTGSPMVAAIDKWIDEHESEDGRRICRKFNLYGYSLSVQGRRPEPCDSGCPRAHIQVPAELVTDGKLERRWSGEAGSGKARPKRGK